MMLPPPPPLCPSLVDAMTGGQATPQLREDKDGNTVLSGVEEREVSTFDDAVQASERPHLSLPLSPSR